MTASPYTIGVSSGAPLNRSCGTGELETPAIASYFQPQYSATIGGETVASVSLPDLIQRGAPTDINFAALNVFLRSDFYIGTDTVFQHIRAWETLPPTSLVTQPTDLGRAAIIDAYIDLFRQAMQRQIEQCEGQRVCMGLSGGRDSRHILLELCRAGAAPELSWTVDLPNAPAEVTVAQSLASRAGLAHKLLPPAASVKSERYKNRATNFESTEHGWITTAVPIIQDYDAIYDGLAGDVLSAGLFLTQAARQLVHAGRIDEFIEQLVVRPGPVPLVRDQSLFPLQDALEAVSKEFRRHLAMPNPIGSFYLWNRTRRAVGASAVGLLCPTGQRVCLPYLDSDLFRFLASLPDTVVVDHELHTDTICRAFPEYADVPYAQKTETARALSRNRNLAADTSRYLLRQRSSLLDTKGALLRLARAMVSPARLPDVDWLHPFAVYLADLDGNAL